MARENLTYVLAERPTGDIIPGRTFKAERGPAPTADDLKDGEILVESLYLSLDPAMRGWLNGTSARARARLWPHKAWTMHLFCDNRLND